MNDKFKRFLFIAIFSISNEWAYAEADCSEVVALGKIGVSELAGENQKEIITCFEMGAAKGDPVAKYNLALLYYYGKFKQKDAARAEALFKEAADAGHVLSAYNYAVIEEKKGNLEPARVYYRIAAAGGHIASQLVVGQDYEHLGDSQSAHEWYKRASEHNSGEAYFLLAELLFRGKLGEPDIDRACSYMTASKELGYPKAIKFFDVLKRKESRVCRK